MKIQQTHECCGHRAISDLQDIDLKTGEVRMNDSWSLVGRGNPVSLKNILGGPHAAYSWIQGQGQFTKARKLGSEFRKLGFEIIKVDLGHNPGHDKDYTLVMWIAKRTGKSVA